MRVDLLIGLLVGLIAVAGACRRSDAPPASAAEDPSDSVARARDARDDTEIPADAPRVVFLGDSLSAGLYLDGREAFPAVLQRELAAQGLPFRLINAGVSGDTSAGGVRRLPWLLRQRPDVVVLELGYNDGLRGQSTDELERNLRSVVESARAAGARVLLLGARLPPSLGAAYAKRFEAVYASLARDLALPWLPWFLEGVGGQPELNFPDGLHPTAEGHRRVAATVLPALRDLLLEVAAERGTAAPQVPELRAR